MQNCCLSCWEVWLQKEHLECYRKKALSYIRNKYRATSRKVAGSIPDGVIDIIIPAALWSQGWLSF